MTESTDLVTLSEGGLPAAGAIDELASLGGQLVVAEEHSHPGPRQYVIIAVVLVILTGGRGRDLLPRGHRQLEPAHRRRSRSWPR